MSVSYSNQPVGRASRPRSLHKAMLYFIVGDFVLLFVSYRMLSLLNLSLGLAVFTCLLVYNVLIGKIVKLYARRSGDTYIVYPLITCYGILTVMFLRFFLF